MDKKDLEQIEGLFQKGFGSIWEDNLQPSLEGIDERLTIVERKLDKALYREFQRIDQLESDMKAVKEKLGIK